jgi:hypothetical protein
MKFEKQVSLKWAIALVLIACLVSSSIVYYAIAVSPSSPITISGGVYPGAPSYTFWEEGGYYFAKDANGEIDYSGTNATIVIQNAFNQNGSSYLFKAGTYELAGNTVVANAPVRIEGEGKKSIISGGTLKIVGGGLELGWKDNNNLVRGLRFECDGSITPLWLYGVVDGRVMENSFWKTSFYLGNPQLRLTNCLSIYVRYNWFDGYNCQIIRMDGTSYKPYYYIQDNAFGSTSQGTFPTQNNPWEVAAIYIEGADKTWTYITNNVGILNPKNIFVYSEAAATMVLDNDIECGTGNYAIWLTQDSNRVEGNYITLTSSSLGAIYVYHNGDAMYYNSIVNNQIDAGDGIDPIYGTFFYSKIMGNTVFGRNGIRLHNCGYNIVVDNFYRKIGDVSDYALKEDGSSGNNVILNMDAKGGYIYVSGSYTKVNLSWNNTNWIDSYSVP